MTAFSVFTGRKKEEIQFLEKMIDWDKLAMQMAFFMAEGDKYAGHLLDNNIPEEIYGSDVRIKYSDNYSSSRGWVDRAGEKGWYFDGINPDLGPVNGPNPLQELIKANYLFTSFMIDDELAGHVVIPSESDILERFEQQNTISTNI